MMPEPKQHTHGFYTAATSERYTVARMRAFSTGQVIAIIHINRSNLDTLRNQGFALTVEDRQAQNNPDDPVWRTKYRGDGLPWIFEDILRLVAVQRFAELGLSGAEAARCLQQPWRTDRAPAYLAAVMTSNGAVIVPLANKQAARMLQETCSIWIGIPLA